METAKLIVVGAAGKMGRRIVLLAAEADEFDVVGAIEGQRHPDIGKDAGLVAGTTAMSVNVDSSYPAGADVVVDFSVAEAADKTVGYCLENSAALVLGTTGLSAEQHKRLNSASERIPIIYATNMSVGMNVLFTFVGEVASRLGDDYDIEIIEQHHRFKKDAPSGSSLTLAENICKVTGRDFPGCVSYGRKGKDSMRQKGEIGIHAIRAGDITGVHSVIFSTLGETVTLKHAAHTRDGFARGALRAAKWLVAKKAGMYSMAEVLGLR